ncbi:MAG TPA: PAS domain-containing protein, partial [Actinotalea sp.]
MVNPASAQPSDAALAVYRDRALRATDVSFVITDGTDPRGPIVWVNEAFTRTTGYRLEEVVGRSPNVLQGPGTDRAEVARMTQAVSECRPVTVTVLNYRRDGSPFWNQVSLSPVPDDDGVVTHWVGIQVDVTEQVEHAAQQALSIQAERRARSGLALVSRVSDILADLDDPYVLREIATLLRPEVVSFAEFFLADGALQPTSGIDAGAGPVVRRARRPEALRSSVDRPLTDPVQELLDTRRETPLELSLLVPPDEHYGPTTTWLVQHLRAAGRTGGADAVVVDPIRGRRNNVGVLVSVPRSGTGLAGMDDNDRTVVSLVARRVGMAVENVRLYAREHRLAETLQRAMLPEQAEVRGLDVWTYYAPSSGHAQVGGDWYDVVQVAPELVTVVIGDVVGHDVEAAAA